MLLFVQGLLLLLVLSESISQDCLQVQRRFVGQQLIAAVDVNYQISWFFPRVAQRDREQLKKDSSAHMERLHSLLEKIDGSITPGNIFCFKHQPS